MLLPGIKLVALSQLEQLNPNMTTAATLGIDPLFHDPVEFLSTDARVALSYKRARLLMHEHGMKPLLISHMWLTTMFS